MVPAIDPGVAEALDEFVAKKTVALRVKRRSPCDKSGLGFSVPVE